MNQADDADKHGGFDRRDGTGKRERARKTGGENPAKMYKKKDADTIEAAESATIEEQKEETKAEEPKEVEEIIGVSLDDFLADKAQTIKKEGRGAEKISGVKVQAKASEKEHHSTVLKNQYGYGVYNKGAFSQSDQKISIGFQAQGDEEGPAEGGRGGRGGRGGKGRGGRDLVSAAGGRRQTAKQALKKTEEDFPTL